MKFKLKKKKVNIVIGANAEENGQNEWAGCFIPYGGELGFFQEYSIVRNGLVFLQPYLL